MVGNHLTDGTYYWVVYTIDLFENTGRSREATFKVGDTAVFGILTREGFECTSFLYHAMSIASIC